MFLIVKSLLDNQIPKINNGLMLDDQRGFGVIHIVFIIILMAIVGALAYYLGSKNTLKPIPSPYPISRPSIMPSYSPITQSTESAQIASPSANISPALLENIKASVVSKNTAALEGYMIEPVHVIIEATECCGMLTKVKAIKEMDYLNTASLPWNFDDNNPIALQLKQKNPTAFPEGIIIGTSANRLLVAFTLNQDKTKIEKIYMAIDYKLQGI